jgi:hypothetical protein
MKLLVINPDVFHLPQINPRTLALFISVAINSPQPPLLMWSIGADKNIIDGLNAMFAVHPSLKNVDIQHPIPWHPMKMGTERGIDVLNRHWFSDSIDWMAVDVCFDDFHVRSRERVIIIDNSSKSVIEMGLRIREWLNTPSNNYSPSMIRRNNIDFDSWDQIERSDLFKLCRTDQNFAQILPPYFWERLQRESCEHSYTLQCLVVKPSLIPKYFKKEFDQFLKANKKYSIGFVPDDPEPYVQIEALHEFLYRNVCGLSLPQQVGPVIDIEKLYQLA